MIGKIFTSSNCGEFQVIEKIDISLKKGRIYFKVKFLKTGYIAEVSKECVLNGKVKDRLFPIVYGVGYLGKAKKSKNLKEYSLWTNMLQRCYYEKYKNKVAYSEVEVCDEWKNFENFLNDLPNIPYYNEWINGEKLELDKDIKSKGDRIYSPSTCIFTDRQGQCDTIDYFKAQEHRNISVQIVKDNKTCNYKSISQLHRDMNFNLGQISQALKNGNTVKGWKVKYLDL